MRVKVWGLSDLWYQNGDQMCRLEAEPFSPQNPEIPTFYGLCVRDSILHCQIRVDKDKQVTEDYLETMVYHVPELQADPQNHYNIIPPQPHFFDNERQPQFYGKWKTNSIFF